MNKLLSAGFARLKKDKVFWWIVGFMVFMAFFSIIYVYLDMKEYGYTVGLESLLFNHVLFMGILTAAFSGLFVGTEYSEGTIRNKLVIGHTRRNIYISSLIICIVAGSVICISYIVAAMILGLPVLGFSEGDYVEILLQIFVLILLATAAFSAIFVTCSMLNQNKALNCVIILIGAVAMLLFSAYIYGRLNEPEMWEEYTYMDEETGEVVIVPEEPNPFYISGTQREVYEFLMYFLPSGQLYLCAEGNVSHGREMAVCSILIIIGSSAAGLYCFKKKDIK